MTANLTHQRRYDLDWLRVIAFGLLIFYHIGMYYVPWGWHVKSPYAGPFAEPAMMLLNPWRLSLLFLISGVAIRFAADKAPPLPFAGKRFIRLFIPLVFGMLVIVVPQPYFELLRHGEIEPGFWAFYQSYLSGADYSVTVPTWNHLWYVVYLIVYTLLAVALMPLLRRLSAWLDSEGFERLMGGGRIMVLLVLPFILFRFTTAMWFETTHDLVNDWNQHANYFTIFLYGILFAKSGAFWRSLANQWRLCLLTAFGLGLVLSPVWANWEAWTDGQQAFTSIARAARVLYAWAAILSLLGFAQEYLNRPSALLTYLTKAIFPYYILHQTLIVVFGVWLSGLALGVVGEFTALVVLTAVGCFTLYEYVIRPVPLLKPLFGVFDQTEPFRKALAKPVPAE